MDSNLAEEKLIRAYLLGTLTEEDAEEMDLRLLQEEEFTRKIDLIEDEIIEDYLDGSLTRSEVRAVEMHFLRPPSRRQKLSFARLLRAHVGNKQARDRNIPSITFLPRGQKVYWGTVAAMAILLVLSSGSGIYVVKLRHDLQIENARNRNMQNTLQAQLEQEQRRSAELREELAAVHDHEQTVAKTVATSVLTLELLSVARRGDPVPEAKFTAEAKKLRIRIPLIDWPQIPYDVVLKSADEKELWSKRRVSPNRKLQLEFLVPLKGLSPGMYSIVVNGNEENPLKRTYYFRISSPFSQ